MREASGTQARDRIVVAVGACAWIAIAVAFFRAWPWATAIFTAELVGLGFSVRYTLRRPLERRRLGYAVIIAVSVVLLASVLVLVWALVMASASSLAPP